MCDTMLVAVRGCLAAGFLRWNSTEKTLERTVIILLDSLLSLTPADILRQDHWHVARTSDSQAVVKVGKPVKFVEGVKVCEVS